MENMEYLIKHVNKVDKIMRKAAFPYKRDNFVPLNIIEFEIEESNERLGYAQKINHCKYRIGINKKYFNNKYKRRYNKELLNTLAHEFIHIYTILWHDMKTQNIKLNYSEDSSPIFCAYVIWFNRHTDLKIKMNNNLYKAFYIQEYFDLDESKDFDKFQFNIMKLEYKIEDWFEELEKEIAQQSKQMEDVYDLAIIKFNSDNLWNSKISRIYTTISNQKFAITEINLGMLDLFETEQILSNHSLMIEDELKEILTTTIGI